MHIFHLGKTSTIMACAKKMYGEHYSSMTLELNASDDRGIDVVRNQIKEFAGTKKLFSSGIKLIILDEADAMTSEAQAALRRVISFNSSFKLSLAISMSIFESSSSSSEPISSKSSPLLYPWSETHKITFYQLKPSSLRCLLPSWEKCE